MRCQQYELYASERGVPHGRKFRDAAEMQEYVDALREHPYWQMFAPQVRRVEVYTDGRKRGSVGFWDAQRSAGLVEFGPPEHRCELVVLHEVSHVIADARTGDGSNTAHGPVFARTFLELVRVAMGPGAYLELYTAFEEHGIEHDVVFGRLGAGRQMGAAS